MDTPRCGKDASAAGRRRLRVSDSERPGNRHVYADARDFDVPARAILLAPDEADQVAEILHSQPVADRLLLLERRVDELIGERGR
jgi:hypothetical protein